MQIVVLAGYAWLALAAVALLILIEAEVVPWLRGQRAPLLPSRRGATQLPGHRPDSSPLSV